MNIITAAVIGILLSLLFAVAAALLYSLPVMLLWNAVVPDVLGVKPLNWTNALWLSLLCSLLFKTTSFSGGAS